MTAKAYHVEHGVVIDADFAAHRDTCAACQHYMPLYPETLACLCLEGSILWKRENAVKRNRFFIPDEGSKRRG